MNFEMIIQEKKCNGRIWDEFWITTYLFNLLTSAPLVIIDLITYDIIKVCFRHVYMKKKIKKFEAC